ncbi:AMBRA1 [Bugula neritina]|uniref:AMBRA1 n=1 Tax=Bugula neritina TaxID=10212 RepID=A0A7J7JIC3_BUGNE|nr:AMBRA1 [Bugula neritina]
MSCVYRLLLQQVNCLRSYQRRMSGVSNESRTRLRNLIESISSYCTRQAVAGFDLPSALTPSIPLQGVTVSSQTTYSDSSTNTERPAHRSLGVSTDESLLDSRPRRSRSSSVSLSSVGLWEDDRLSGPVGLPLIRHYSRPRHYHLQTSRHQQVQRWRLDDEVKDLSDESNVIIRRCKIHNDASIDISQDGTILALLVVNPNTASCPGIHSGTLPDTMLRLISLREETLGDVLHQLALVANPVSLSLSPLNSYIIVGLSGSTNNIDHPMIKYDIYKIPPQPGQKLKMCRSVFTTRNDSPMAKVNCVRWLPMSGQGLVIGTNQGHVIINHSVSSNTSTLNDALR